MPRYQLQRKVCLLNSLGCLCIFVNYCKDTLAEQSIVNIKAQKSPVKKQDFFVLFLFIIIYCLLIFLMQ